MVGGFVSHWIFSCTAYLSAKFQVGRAAACIGTGSLPDPQEQVVMVLATQCLAYRGEGRVLFKLCEERVLSNAIEAWTVCGSPVCQWLPVGLKLDTGMDRGAARLVPLIASGACMRLLSVRPTNQDIYLFMALYLLVCLFVYLGGSEREEQEHNGNAELSAACSGGVVDGVRARCRT